MSRCPRPCPWCNRPQAEAEPGLVRPAHDQTCLLRGDVWCVSIDNWNDQRGVDAQVKPLLDAAQWFYDWSVDPGAIDSSQDAIHARHVATLAFYMPEQVDENPLDKPPAGGK